MATVAAFERVPDVDRALVYTPAGRRPEMEARGRRRLNADTGVFASY